VYIYSSAVLIIVGTVQYFSPVYIYPMVGHLTHELSEGCHRCVVTAGWSALAKVSPAHQVLYTRARVGAFRVPSAITAQYITCDDHLRDHIISNMVQLYDTSMD
jgi:hypothetical protein